MTDFLLTDSLLKDSPKTRPAGPIAPLHPMFLLPALLLPVSLVLGGCAGTGTMFKPETSTEGVTYYYSADGSVHTVPLDGAEADSSEGAEYSADAAEEGTGEGDGTSSLQEASGQGPETGLTDPDGSSQSGAPDGNSGNTGRRSGVSNRRSGGTDPAGAGSEPEEKRRKSVTVDGTGSDLFRAQTIDNYYEFTLDGATLALPCSVSSLLSLGWDLQVPAAGAGDRAGTDPNTGADERTEPVEVPDSPEAQVPQGSRDGQTAPGGQAPQDLQDGPGAPASPQESDTAPAQDTGASGSDMPAPADPAAAGTYVIPPYSFEFFDAVPAGEDTETSSFFSRETAARRIRICIANFHSTPRDPSDCTLCGISASLDSGVSLQTAFGSGPGDSLDSLTSAFGTDRSIYTLTDYDDGTRTVSYRFINGLTEEEEISVLAEAEEKSLSDLLLAETAEDGSTIRALSLFYFKVP